MTRGPLQRFVIAVLAVVGLGASALFALGVPGATHHSASGLQRDPSDTTQSEDSTPSVLLAGPGVDVAPEMTVPPVATGPSCLQHAVGDFVETLGGDPDGRRYRIHVPPGNGDMPLVLNFHGSSRSASDQEAYSRLVPVADANAFVLVTPEGSGEPSGWNIPGIYHEDGIDDVAFVAELVRQVEGEGCIDVDRVYATGFSNGAEMAAQVACELPDVFAAVAPVSGAVYQGCQGRAIPMVVFHGRDDANVDFDWGRAATEAWAAHDGCQRVEVAALTPNVSRESYQECVADVVFYDLADGGHTWPGSADDSGGVGPTDHDVDAATSIWQFFAAHPKPIQAPS